MKDERKKDREDGRLGSQVTSFVFFWGGVVFNSKCFISIPSYKEFCEQGSREQSCAITSDFFQRAAAAVTHSLSPRAEPRIPQVHPPDIVPHHPPTSVNYTGDPQDNLDCGS